MTLKTDAGVRSRGISRQRSADVCNGRRSCAISKSPGFWVSLCASRSTTKPTQMILASRIFHSMRAASFHTASTRCGLKCLRWHDGRFQGTAVTQRITTTGKSSAISDGRPTGHSAWMSVCEESGALRAKGTKIHSGCYKEYRLGQNPNRSEQLVFSLQYENEQAIDHEDNNDCVALHRLFISPEAPDFLFQSAQAYDVLCRSAARRVCE